MNAQSADAPGQRSPGRRPPQRQRLAPILIPAAVFAAIAGTITWSAWPLVQPARKIEVAQVLFSGSASTLPSASTAKPSASASGVQAPGWLEADPFLVAASGLADGIVESIEVLEGEYVEQGQIVARLVADDAQLRLRAAEAELTRAQASLANAEADHRAAQSNWEHPIALQRAVATSRAALDESQADLARLPSLIASAEATLVSLEEQRDRVQQSTQRNVANDIELIVAQQAVEAHRNELAALEASRGILQARIDRLAAELDFAERDLELRISDRQRVDAAQAVLHRAQADVDRATVRRDEAALELERMTIRAPVSGFVQRRLKIPGDKLIRMMDSPHSTHVVHLYDPSKIQVRVDIPLADAAGVSVSQTCEVIVEVLPDRVFRGEVTRITHEADLQKNTLQAKVSIIDPDPLLRPEMLTRVKFLAGHTPSASAQQQSSARGQLLVPSTAIARQGDTTLVWLVTDRRRGRGVLEPRSVSVIGRDGDWTAVDADLQPGDLVAAGVSSAQAGERVVLTTLPTSEGGAS